MALATERMDAERLVTTSSMTECVERMFDGEINFLQEPMEVN